MIHIRFLFFNLCILVLLELHALSDTITWDCTVLSGWNISQHGTVEIIDNNYIEMAGENVINFNKSVFVERDLSLDCKTNVIINYYGFTFEDTTDSAFAQYFCDGNTTDGIIVYFNHAINNVSFFNNSFDLSELKCATVTFRIGGDVNADSDFVHLIHVQIQYDSCDLCYMNYVHGMQMNIDTETLAHPGNVLINDIMEISFDFAWTDNYYNHETLIEIGGTDPIYGGFHSIPDITLNVWKGDYGIIYVYFSDISRISDSYFSWVYRVKDPALALLKDGKKHHFEYRFSKRELIIGIDSIVWINKTNDTYIYDYLNDTRLPLYVHYDAVSNLCFNSYSKHVKQQIVSVDTYSKYLVINETKTWSDAQFLCTYYFGTNLATIQSDNDWYEALGSIRNTEYSENQIWTGLYNKLENNEDIWQWVDATDSTVLNRSTFNLYSGQCRGTSRDKIELQNCCGSINVELQNLNDAHCQNQQYFMCAGNMKYAIISTPYTWSQAYNHCKKVYNSTLATIQTEHDKNEFQLLIKSAGVVNKHIWIGTYYNNSEIICHTYYNNSEIICHTYYNNSE
eukprot:159614_1